MSIENVKHFYAELRNNPGLHQQALQLQAKYEKQEEIIDAFLLLARENGFPFTEHDFMTYVLENGEEVKNS